MNQEYYFKLNGNFIKMYQTRQEEKCILKLPFCSPFPCMAQTCASRYNKVLGKKEEERNTEFHLHGFVFREIQRILSKLMEKGNLHCIVTQQYQNLLLYILFKQNSETVFCEGAHLSNKKITF